ncbi:hypothetical protein [Pseudooceanicola sp. MF1-13]|uniref:hypothetical protein n=1 Tax=Pseudooceanicola sp. MF1-13 TaxID=3379095 RepID=UPI003891D974
MCAQVSGASDDADTDIILEQILQSVRDDTADRCLLDLSDQTSSSLNAVSARAALSNLNIGLAKIWGDDLRQLPLAIVTPMASFGYGIGRMIAGHAYDLSQLSVAQFESVDEAMDWLSDDTQRA